jgi:hypothetical protein
LTNRTSAKHGTDRICAVLCGVSLWQKPLGDLLTAVTTSGKLQSIVYKGSNWIKRPIVLTAEALRRDLLILGETHQSMVSAISSLSPAMLKRIPKNSRVNNEAIIRGIASHDVYHAGQIQLLKRLMK